MLAGFHASSLLLHDEAAIVGELDALGYKCVAIRPRCGVLNPDDERFSSQMIRLADAVNMHRMKLVIDTEGAFLADPKHFSGPSLSSPDAGESQRAEESIARWISIAAEFDVPLITFDSGADSSTDPWTPGRDESTLNRITERIDRLVELASQSGVRLALRPASGEAVATVAQFERLSQWIREPSKLYLAADVAEMLQEGEFPVADRLARNLTQLACVYLRERGADRSRDQLPEDCEIDLQRIARSLHQLGFAGYAIARIDGHPEKGLILARDALEWFQQDV